MAKIEINLIKNGLIMLFKFYRIAVARCLQNIISEEERKKLKMGFFALISNLLLLTLT